MIRLTLIVALAFAFLNSSARSASLWDELLDVTVHRLQTSGPDRDIAQFISLAHEQAWARRDIFFSLSRDYLDNTDPSKVSAALEVLYRLRGFRPTHRLGAASFEEVNADFFLKLDRVVFAHYSHFKALQNDDVYNSLSLYLGITPSAEARQQLKEIAGATNHNEQTLICLAWQRNPADMDFLLPFMLADTPVSRCLPYHFRNSYGQAAIPYLRRATSEAKVKATRKEAREELKRIEH